MLILVEESKSSEIKEDEQEIPAETRTSEEVESQVNILEVIFWGITCCSFQFLDFSLGLSFSARPHSNSY